MEEIWKQIKGYEGLYWISNYGNIKNKKKLLHPYKHKDGYLFIDLCKDGRKKTMSIHRLVALHFIDNPNNYAYVNHKDEQKNNNNQCNLEWCEFSYNINYGSRNERTSQKLMNRKNESYKIAVYTKNNELIGIYPSIKEASRQLHINRTTIGEALRLRNGISKNHIFRRF